MPVDKYYILWLNFCILYIGKDDDGKFAFFGSFREPAGGVSRCERKLRSDSRVGSVKARQVMEPGFPRYGIGLAGV